MVRTVAEPCDRPGCATLIADTGSGHLLGGCWRGSGGVAETTLISPGGGITSALTDNSAVEVVGAGLGLRNRTRCGRGGDGRRHGGGTHRLSPIRSARPRWPRAQRGRGRGGHQWRSDHGRRARPRASGALGRVGWPALPGRASGETALWGLAKGGHAARGEVDRGGVLPDRVVLQPASTAGVHQRVGLAEQCPGTGSTIIVVWKTASLTNVNVIASPTRPGRDPQHGRLQLRGGVRVPQRVLEPCVQA
jgi:hypothetical protein